MDRTGRLVRAARRRLTNAAIVERVGWGLAWGAAFALASTAVFRLFSLDAAFPWWIPLASSLAIGGVSGACLGLLRRPTPLAAAAWVDVRLKLKDRLSTGTALVNVSNDAFARLAVDESDAAAGSVDLTRAIRLTWGGSWLVWPLLTGMAIIAGLFVPAWGRAGGSKTPALVRDNGERQFVAKEIEQAAEVAKSDLPFVAASLREIEELEEIRRQLERGRTSPEDAASEAARSLDRLSDDAERRADKSDRADQEFRNRLASLGGMEPATDGAPTSPLSEAIRRGDLDAAADSASQLLDPASAPTRQDKESIAESLNRLARDLDTLAKADRATPTGDRGVDGALSDAGADPESARGIAERDGEDALKRALEAAGTPTEKSGELADRTQTDVDERRARDQARQDMQSLAESLRNAAEELRNAHDTPDSPPPSTDGENASPQARGDRPRIEQSGERRPSESPDQRIREPESRNRPDSPRQQTGGDGTAPDANRPGSTDADRDGQQSAKAPPGTSQPTAGEPASQQDPARPGTTPAEQSTTPPRDTPIPASNTGDRASASSGDRQRDDPAQPATRPGSESPAGDAPAAPPVSSAPPNREGSGSSVQDLARRLERLARAAKHAASDRNAADGMRRRAQDLLDRSSPEQREQLKQWAERATRDTHTARGTDPGSPGAEPGRGDRTDHPDAIPPPRTRLIDARSRDDLDQTPRDEHTAAEWLASPTPGTAPAPGLAQRIDRAQRSAEQAIENRSIPPRFDALLRRYFQRLPDRVRPAPQGEQGLPQPAEPAKDAD